MVRIAVDQSKCAGHARCFATAPQVFPIDDDGYTALDGIVEIDDELAERARLGAAACPERVITLLDG
jgi:ferredoxin